MDFWSLGSHFGRLGVASGVHFGRLGLLLDLLGRYLGVSLWVLGCCGGPFCGSRGGPGHLRRAVVAKDRGSLSRPSPFLTILAPKEYPEGTQNGGKIGKTWSQKSVSFFCLIFPQFLKRCLMIEHAVRNTAAAPF